MRKSKLRLDWWESGMDWVNELTLQPQTEGIRQEINIYDLLHVNFSRKISQERSNRCHAKYAKETWNARVNL